MYGYRFPIATDSGCDTDCILAATSLCIVGGLAILCFGTILRMHCVGREEQQPVPYNAIDNDEV